MLLGLIKTFPSDPLEIEDNEWWYRIKKLAGIPTGFQVYISQIFPKIRLGFEIFFYINLDRATNQLLLP